MPIKISSLSTKIKPVVLGPLVQGNTKLMTDANLKSETISNFTELVKAIRKTINPDDAIGTSVEGVVIMNGSTLKIKKSNLFFFIPPNKSSNYEMNYLKPIRDKVSKTSAAKEIDVWTLTYLGTNPRDKHVFEVTPSHTKMTKIKEVVKWLNTKWTPDTVVVKLAGSSSDAPSTDDVKDGASILEEYKSLSKQLKTTYPDTLLADAEQVSPLLVQLEVGIKGLEKLNNAATAADDLSEPEKAKITISYGKWLKKFQDAVELVQNGPSTENESTDEEVDPAVADLEKRLNALEQEKENIVGDTSMDLEAQIKAYSFLMGRCQLIGATPNYKAVFKRAAELKEQFNRILTDVQTAFDGNQELKAEMMKQIKEAGQVSAGFKAEIENDWNAYREKTKKFTTVKVAKRQLDAVIAKIKGSQELIENRSRGLILLAKRLNPNNKAAVLKISEHMTKARSIALKHKKTAMGLLEKATVRIDNMDAIMERTNISFDEKIKLMNVEVNAFRDLVLEI